MWSVYEENRKEIHIGCTSLLPICENIYFDTDYCKSFDIGFDYRPLALLSRVVWMSQWPEILLHFSQKLPVATLWLIRLPAILNSERSRRSLINYRHLWIYGRLKGGSRTGFNVKLSECKFDSGFSGSFFHCAVPPFLVWFISTQIHQITLEKNLGYSFPAELLFISTLSGDRERVSGKESGRY